MVTLEIQFSCSSGIAEFCLLEVATIYLVIFQPFFPKVYSLVCVVIEVSILLALQPFSDLTKISFKKKKKVFRPFKFSHRCCQGKLLQFQKAKTQTRVGLSPPVPHVAGRLTEMHNPKVLENKNLTAHPGISQPLQEWGMLAGSHTFLPTTLLLPTVSDLFLHPAPSWFLYLFRFQSCKIVDSEVFLVSS